MGGPGPLVLVAVFLLLRQALFCCQLSGRHRTTVTVEFEVDKVVNVRLHTEFCVVVGIV